ncbi:MAG: UTP--glucose-1-phosphate uridylyltransferase [Gammaproteobacteria bacterium]|nr:UTP--glucose-1-phosphate uridylyltransferase [Gammaproteobacteria bacterium]
MDASDPRFLRLLEAVRSGPLRPGAHTVSSTRIAPLLADATTEIARLPADRRAGLEAAGREALQAGRLGRIVLNGGMATRFGGVVKALVKVFDDQDFLDLKLRQAQKLEAALELPPAPVALMVSFATEAATREALLQRDHYGRSDTHIALFRQEDMPRVNLSGGYPAARPHDSRSACGHGDFLDCFAASGLLDNWLQRGITHIDFSNLDNLGATLDPLLFGTMLDSGAEMMIEVAHKRDDRGGAACRVDDQPRVLEGPYFPPDFDHRQLPLFNTNNLWFELAALRELVQRPDREALLPWHLVEKTVDGQPLAQLERFAIDLCHVLRRIEFATVPRDGDRGRFFPIKTPEDLAANREMLRRRLG